MEYVKDPERIREILRSTQDAPCDPVAIERNKVATFNADSKEPQGYNCPICKNRGRIAYMREDMTAGYRDCKCAVTRRCLKLMDQSGLTVENLNKYKFETFQAREPWQETMLQKAVAYSEDPKGSFMLGGQSGCGKSHLCTAICGRLLKQGREVIYVSWCQILPVLKNYEERKRREKLMEDLKTAEFLYLDDFLKPMGGGRVQITEGDLKLAFELIDYRFCREKPTILSTELSLVDLRTLDDALGSRIIQMTGKNQVHIQKNPERNYRCRKQ